MLDLDSPEWAQLRHAYGSARDVPAMIRDLREGENDDDAWDQIWSSLCHQGDVYPASYAAVPHIVAVAEQRPIEEQADFWIFVGAIACKGTGGAGGLPDVLRTAYLQALERVAPAVFESLAGGAPDETQSIYLLQTLAAILAAGKVGERLQCLVDEALDGSCPSCNGELFFRIGAEGVHVAMLGVHTGELPVEPAPHVAVSSAMTLASLRRAPCSQWLPQLAEKAGHPGLAERIRALYGKATCPGCSRVFRPLEDLKT